MGTQFFETGFYIPEGLRIYAIGDIHGYANVLDRMHDVISFDLIEDQPEQVHIVYLGDYIDRGPDSKGVIDRLIHRRDRGDGIQKTFLLGNHENGMLEFLRDPEGEVGGLWTQWGGMEAMESYGITFEGGVILPAELTKASAALKQKMGLEHERFLNECELSLEIGDYVFAHAGVDPSKPLSQQSKLDLIFNREPFMSWPQKMGFMVVHGHTIESHQPTIKQHRINVDTGLYEGGCLTAAVLEGNKVRFLNVAAH